MTQTFDFDPDNRDDFEQAIRQDMFGAPVLWLQTPEMIDQWIDELILISQGVMNQLASAREEERIERAQSFAGEITRDDYERRRTERAGWKRRALDFKKAADRRLREAKEIRADLNRQAGQAKDTLEKYALRLAIKEHRKAAMATGREPAEHDLDLWAALMEVPQDKKDRTS